MMALELYRLLKEKRKTISFVESMTGGILSYWLLLVPGASTVCNLNMVTYSNESKVRELQVDPVLIEKHSVVSREVALQMAEGMKNKSGADVVVSTTGNAGPAIIKGTSALVCYFAVLIDQKKHIQMLEFDSKCSRSENITSAATQIYQFLIAQLKTVS